MLRIFALWTDAEAWARSKVALKKCLLPLNMWMTISETLIFFHVERLECSSFSFRYRMLFQFVCVEGEIQETFVPKYFEIR